MSKMDIDALLKANPKAAEHADSIHKIMKDINELREAGVQGAGFDLVPPFGRPRNLGGISKVRARGSLLTRLKESTNT